MRTQILLSIALSASLLAASPPLPRPSSVPRLPNAAKPVAEYSASDLLGAVCTALRVIPQGHPYLGYAKDWPRLKADWHGAQDAANIEALIQIAIDAPEEEWSSGVWTNIQAIIRNLMAVDDNAKVNAVIHVVDQQAEPKKRHNAILYVDYLFDEFLDARLLGVIASELDDVTSYTDRYSQIQGMAPETHTYRGDARSSILDKLKGTLRMNIDKDVFRLGEEAAGCGALKDWLNAHRPEIEAKCADMKADPDRWLPPLVRTSWGL